MTTQTPGVSVTVPVSQALDRVKEVLFRPFDLGKWFTIGFCAWLAYLGEGGGGGGGGNYNFGERHGTGNVRHEFEHARDYIADNLFWIAPVAIALVTIGIALWLLFIWLSSRGKFMFLHCVALNKAEVVLPWKKFASVANSLFWFRIVLGLIGMVVILPVIGLGVFAGIQMGMGHGWMIQGILGLIGLGFLTLALLLAFKLVSKFTMDFVVPIMFLRGKRCVEAWREFWELLTANVGHFALYILFQIVLSIVIGVIVLMIVLVTCCCAGCLLAIPYVGTVFFLPVLVFNRAYSLHYFAQYGPSYDVFPPVAPPAAAA